MTLLSRRAFWAGLPWATVVASLWGGQAWAVWDSESTLEITLLQFPFFLVFIVLIFVIAEARVWERSRF